MTTAPKQDTQPAEAIAAAAQPAEAIAAPVGGLSLRKNFSWTFVGNVVYAACQWGILVVLAKLGTPEMVGQFALGLAVTAPVMMFSMLQLRGVQATDAKREYQFGDYLALRLITTALALAAIGGIVALGGYRRETALVILIIGALKGIDALSDVYYGLWQQHERMDGIAQALMLNGVVSTATLAALMWTTRSVVIAVLGSATGSLAAYLFTLAKNKRLALAKGPAAHPRWIWRSLWKLVRLASPLGAVALLWSLNNNVPRYFIQRALGEAHLGIFAAIGYVVIAGTAIVSALGQSASPRLSRYFCEGRSWDFARLYSSLLWLALVLGGLGLAVSLLWGCPILMFLYGPEYAEFIGVFRLLMFVAGMKYMLSFTDYALVAVRRFQIQFIACVAGTLLMAVSAFWGVERFGLIGASWAILVGAAAHLAIAIPSLVKVVKHGHRSPKQAP